MRGKRLPDVVFKTRVRDDTLETENPFRWEDKTTADFFRGKRVILFSLPGAFTPTCTNEQLPAYERMFMDFRNAGIDGIYCMSVNDAFVMFQWGKHLNVKNVKFIPDGNGDFTRRMGMLIDKRHLGFGMRSWRYAAVITNGVVEKWFEEPGINDIGNDEDPYGVSSADNIMGYLKTMR